MGSVYAAEQLSTGRIRAVKLLRPVLAADPVQRERFRREARAASGVASEHIIEVIDAGIDEATGMPWLAMELLEGGTLAELLEREPILPAARMATMFEQLGHGLAAAHAAGLIHRDIKPENIYLAAPRSPGLPFSVKVLDFGIAKLLDEANLDGGSTLSVGSPLWMAPEQGAPGAISAAADVWALGLVAFRCLTGRCFWVTAASSAPSLAALITEIMTRDIPPGSARARELGFTAQLPAGFDGWLGRCLQRDPAARFPEAGACVRALLPLLRGGATGLEETLPPSGSALAETLPPPGTQAPDSLAPTTGPGVALQAPAERPPPTRWPLLAGLVAVMVGAAGWLGWWLLRPVPRASIAVLDARSAVAAALDARPRRALDGASVPAAALDARSAKREAGSRPRRSPAMGAVERAYFDKVVRFCWRDRLLSKDPPPADVAEILLTITGNGRVEAVRVLRPADPSFKTCVVFQSGAYRFGPSVAGTLTIRAPLPAGAAPR